MRSHALGCKTKDADKGEGVDGICREGAIVVGCE
jgi:hypothetical protein